MNAEPAKPASGSVSTLKGVIAQTRRRAGEGHLSVSRQLLEMLVLRMLYGLGPGHYHTARYWRKDLPWEFKRGFWPYSKFRRFVNRLNPPAYQKLSQHKLCEKAILQVSGIPTPRFLGRLQRHTGVSFSGTPLTGAEELHALLLENDRLDKLCFKLVEGYGGQGFRAVECIRGVELTLRMLDTGEMVSVAEFVSRALGLEDGADYIVEEYIEQHPEMGRLNPSSVNTLRVWASSVAGKTTVIDAFLRVGRRGSLVDNTSRGAQIFRIDLASGVVGEGMEKNIYNDTFHCHRDSGLRISGTGLPCWGESLALAQQAVAAFPNIQFAGVDIAIAVDGPVVVELNVEPDPTSALIFDRCHRDLLKVFKSVAPY